MERDELVVSRTPASKCPVCADLLSSGSIRTCSRCETRTHTECWDYGGGCPRFACSESRCLREMALRCPTCGSSTYATWSWKHPLIIHWMLNPGLAFNELVLGQRLPAVMFVCKSCPAPVQDRTWIVCPHCQRVIPSMLWARGMAFGHWMGLVCPFCQEEVPTLRNLTALLFVIITFPIWFLVQPRAKSLYLEWTRERTKQRLLEMRAADTPALIEKRAVVTKERLLALEDGS